MVVIAAVGIVAAGGIGYAAIPAADGQVKGCYAKTNGLLLGIPHSKGDLRIVDEDEACRSYETTSSGTRWASGVTPEPPAPGAPSAREGRRGPMGLMAKRASEVPKGIPVRLARRDQRGART